MSTGTRRPGCVVLVHGLYMRGFWMRLMRRRLNERGYRAFTFSYPSLVDDVATNADALHQWLDNIDVAQVDFVAHSLGGLLLRHLFQRHPGQRPGRVVTLGTPHQPSAAARSVASLGLGVALGRSRVHGLLGGAPPWAAHVEIGSIAGENSLGLGRLFGRLPVPNDGAVAVAETRFEGMTDHRVLPVTHVGLIFSRRVVQCCDVFLRTGCFDGSVRIAPFGSNS